MSRPSYGDMIRMDSVTKPSAAKRNSVDFKRATYYLRPDQIKALKLRAVLDEENISALVRTALDAYLNPNAHKKRASGDSRALDKKADYLFVSRS